MTNEDIFRVQWDTLTEEMISMINTELASIGRIDFTRLNDVYHTKTGRWSSRSTAEGRWMNSLEDSRAVTEVRSALDQLRLTEATAKKPGSAVVPLGGVGGGILCAVAANIAEVSDPACVAATVAGAAAGFAVTSTVIKKKNAGNADMIRADYRKQLAAAGETISAIWKKYV